MVLPDKKTKGRVTLKELRMLLFGPPKIGKTSLCSGFPNALFLTTEKGYAALRIYAKDIDSWETFKEVNKELTKKKKHKKFETIVIDTIDILFNLCSDYICADLGITHISDEKWAKGYDMLKKEFERELNKLFLMHYGIILISHTKLADVSGRQGSSTKIVPTFSNTARGVIIPKVSVIGCMKLKLIKPQFKGGKYKEKRIITFAPSEFIEAGDRDGKLPEEITTFKDPAKTYAIFKKYYGA